MMQWLRDVLLDYITARRSVAQLDLMTAELKWRLWVERIERSDRKTAADSVRLEAENATLRGSLQAIASGADEPEWVAVKALGDVDGRGSLDAMV